ncbi:hypothetical protein C8R43DRAFT_949290 [Mycena crocata]|nr:hypothetical protein C8R43DRAFT_949290 [Mycena crocata]
MDDILRRSGGAPLHLSVDRKHQAFSDVVLPIRNRLHRLSLHRDINDDPITHLEDPHFPILHALHFSLYFGKMQGNRFSIDTISALLRMFAIAPKLRVLSLYVSPGNPLGLPVPDDRFPWMQLTSLSLHTKLHVSWIRILLPLCPALESLSVRNLDQETPNAVRDVTIVLSSRLSSLALSNNRHRVRAAFRMFTHETDLGSCQLPRPRVIGIFSENRTLGDVALSVPLQRLHLIGRGDGVEGSVVADMLESRIKAPDFTVPLSHVIFKGVYIKGTAVLPRLLEPFRLPGWTFDIIRYYVQKSLTREADTRSLHE